MSKNKQTLSEIKDATPVLRDRLNTERYEVGRVTFVLRALPGILETYVLADANRDNAGAVVNYLRFGIVDIEGLCDADGLKVEIPFDTVTIAGAEYAALGWRILKGLDSKTLNDVVERIVELSERSSNEKRAQDFFQHDTPNLPDAQAASERADA